MDLQHPRSLVGAILLASLAGLLLAATSPPAWLSITALPSLLVFFYSIREMRTDQDIVWPVFAYLFVGWLGSYGWVVNHAWPRTGFVSILLLTLLALAGAVTARAGFRLAGVFGLAAAMMLYEAVLTFGPLAMPLVSMGYSVSGTAWAFLVSLIGITGSSFLMWGLSALVAHGRSRLHAVVLLAWILAAISGVDLRSGRSAAPTVPPVSLVLVQPNIPAEKWAYTHDDRRAEALTSISGAADGLWIWPETALPMGTTGRLDSLMGGLVSADVLAGGIVVSEDGDVYNAAIYRRAPHGTGTKTLEWGGKRRLIPLVETIPGLRFMPWLLALRVDSGGAQGYRPGGKRPVWSVNGVMMSALVCFESLFAAEARTAVLDGAEFLLILSQDGWWDSTRMPLQHRDMTALVARATGRTVVMAGVTGWSGILSEDGAVVHELPMGTTARLRVDVQPRPRNTLYLTAGESFSLLIFLVVTCAGFLRGRYTMWRQRRSQRHD